MVAIFHTTLIRYVKQGHRIRFVRLIAFNSCDRFHGLSAIFLPDQLILVLKVSSNFRIFELSSSILVEFFRFGILSKKCAYDIQSIEPTTKWWIYVSSFIQDSVINEGINIIYHANVTMNSNSNNKTKPATNRFSLAIIEQCQVSKCLLAGYIETDVCLVSMNKWTLQIQSEMHNFNLSLACRFGLAKNNHHPLFVKHCLLSIV